MKFGLRFFVSCLLSSLLMFAMFYFWHGVFLNDFKRIQFPLFWFQVFAAFTYLLFGVALMLLFESHLFHRIQNIVLRGLTAGAILGFTVFMVASIVHISLTRHLSLQHLMMDCAWQIVEQSIGGLVVVLLKVIIHEPQTERV